MITAKLPTRKEFREFCVTIEPYSLKDTVILPKYSRFNNKIK